VKKILFFAETVTLAHATRASVLAKAFDSTKEEVHLAIGEHPAFIARELELISGLKKYDLKSSISSDVFLKALAQGKIPHTRELLDRAVKEDLEFIDRIKPDCIVGDFRLSLGVSAALRKIPYVNLTNLIWSPTNRQKFIVPEHPLVRIFGPSIVGAVSPPLRFLSYFFLAKVFNQLRRRHDLKAFGSLLDVYTQGDLVLYLDPIELFDVAPLLANHFAIGPLFYSADLEVPKELQKLSHERPNILLSMGSSGDLSVLQPIIEGIVDLPVNLIVATAGRSDIAAMAAIHKNSKAKIIMVDYLPLSKILPQCALCITNGGSPTGYLAASVGVPVLGVPYNLDQYLSMNAVAEFGAGLLVRSGTATKREIKQAVEDILNMPQFAKKARELTQIFNKYDTSREFVRLVRERILSSQ
jgi:UDP:flavonoid glycosyltransferase YjiC (YdhE family)